MSGKFLFSFLLPVIHEQKGNKILDDMCGNQENCIKDNLYNAEALR
jgi:hypothetical protein